LLGRAVAGQIVKALSCIPSKPAKKLILGHGDGKLLSFDMSNAASYFGVPNNVISQRIRKTYEKTTSGEAVNA
jgi:hypothetical protein